MPAPVAVVDIGSNSIKVLVAERDPTGQVVSLKSKTIEARISAGISSVAPRLSDDGMKRGVEAVRELVEDARTFNPSKIVLVATSAVRDASNGTEFTKRILAETQLPVRLLSGEEEANSIGRGLSCDPLLGGVRDFYSLDLGGGSLEILSVRDKKIVQALSLRLGCVRLTEQCVKDSNQPFNEEDQRKVFEVARDALVKSGFRFDLPPHAVVVGTGGTITTARAVIAARKGKPMEKSDPILTINELRELLRYVGRCNLEDRKRIPEMPASRADVLPAALATVIAAAEVGGFDAYRNSLYNLRWGIADEALSGD